jgi:hypothetical protein
MSKVGAAMVESMPKPKGQAKLGDENTMFYDEKRGRWVEPGKEGEADAGPLAPPPTMRPGGMGSGTTGGSANQGQSPGGYENAPGGVPTGATPSPPPGSFSMRAAKGRSKYVDAFSLSGPAAAEHAAAAAASDANKAAAGASSSLFPAGLMSPGLMAPGLPGGVFGTGASPPMTMLMIPSPVAKSSLDQNADSTNAWAALPLSPVGRFDRNESETPPVEVAETKTTTPVSMMPPPVATPFADADGSDTQLYRDDPFGATETETDLLAADDDGESSTENTENPETQAMLPPPIVPMKDLRLTEAPCEMDRPNRVDKIKQMLSPSYGDGKVSFVEPKNAASNFFIPAGKSETGGKVVGGGATCADVDDDVGSENMQAESGSYGTNAYGTDAYGHYPDPSEHGAGFGVTADEPFGDGDATTYENENDAIQNLDTNQAPGFFDRDGVWRFGQWPGGEYDQTGVWNEGYWTAERFWVVGFWDEFGAWVDGVRPGGYFDRTGGWVAEEGKTRDDHSMPKPENAATPTAPPETAATNASQVVDALGGLSGVGFHKGDDKSEESDGEMTDMAL